MLGGGGFLLKHRTIYVWILRLLDRYMYSAKNLTPAPCVPHHIKSSGTNGRTQVSGLDYAL